MPYYLLTQEGIFTCTLYNLPNQQIRSMYVLDKIFGCVPAKMKDGEWELTYSFTLLSALKLCR